MVREPISSEFKSLQARGPMPRKLLRLLSWPHIYEILRFGWKIWPEASWKHSHKTWTSILNIDHTSQWTSVKESNYQFFFWLENPISNCLCRSSPTHNPGKCLLVISFVSFCFFRPFMWAWMDFHGFDFQTEKLLPSYLCDLFSCQKKLVTANECKELELKAVNIFALYHLGLEEWRRLFKWLLCFFLIPFFCCCWVLLTYVLAMRVTFNAWEPLRTNSRILITTFRRGFSTT